MQLFSPLLTVTTTQISQLVSGRGDDEGQLDQYKCFYKDRTMHNSRVQYPSGYQRSETMSCFTGNVKPSASHVGRSDNFWRYFWFSQVFLGEKLLASSGEKPEMLLSRLQRTEKHRPSTTGGTTATKGKNYPTPDKQFQG